MTARIAALALIAFAWTARAETPTEPPAGAWRGSAVGYFIEMDPSVLGQTTSWSHILALRAERHFGEHVVASGRLALRQDLWWGGGLTELTQFRLAEPMLRVGGEWKKPEGLQLAAGVLALVPFGLSLSAVQAQAVVGWKFALLDGLEVSYGGWIQRGFRSGAAFQQVSLPCEPERDPSCAETTIGPPGPHPTPVGSIPGEPPDPYDFRHGPTVSLRASQFSLAGQLGWRTTYVGPWDPLARGTQTWGRQPATWEHRTHLTLVAGWHVADSVTVALTGQTTLAPSAGGALKLNGLAAFLGVSVDLERALR